MNSDWATIIRRSLPKQLKDTQHPQRRCENSQKTSTVTVQKNNKLSNFLYKWKKILYRILNEQLNYVLHVQCM